MKHAKKLFALLLVALMVMALGTSAFAASITITKDETGTGTISEAYTYTAYKIFDATYTDGLSGTGTSTAKDPTYKSGDANVAYFMKTGNPWFTTVQSLSTYFDVQPAADGSGYTVVLKEGGNNADTAKGIATELNTALATVNPTGDVYGGKSLTLGSATDVDAGYYLIVSDLGSNLALVTTDVTIVEKNEYPTIIKEFTDGKAFDNKTDTDSAYDSVQIGDTVSYTLTVTIPSGANQAIVITDTYDAGLSPVLVREGEAVAITTTDLADSTTATASAPSSNSFTVTINANDVTANAGRTITITYSATLNKGAALDKVLTNSATLKYGDKYTTTAASVNTSTWTLTINKKAESENGTALKGAQFNVYRGTQADANLVNVVPISDDELATAGITKTGDTVYYRMALADETGAAATIDMTSASSAVIYGLDGDDTYIVVETKAPVGYNLLNDPTTSNAAKEDRTVTVVNLAGSLLPSTGGIGTTIFYVVGGILVVGAGVVLITRKRVGKEN